MDGLGTAGTEVRPSQAASRDHRESQCQGRRQRAMGWGEQQKYGWFIEGLVQTLTKIQIGMKFNLMASPSSQKTSR